MQAAAEHLKTGSNRCKQDCKHLPSNVILRVPALPVMCLSCLLYTSDAHGQHSHLDHVVHDAGPSCLYNTCGKPPPRLELGMPDPPALPLYRNTQQYPALR